MAPVLQCLILGLGIYSCLSISRSDLLSFACQKDEAANSPMTHLGSQDPAETPACLFHHHHPLLMSLLLELADKTFSEWIGISFMLFSVQFFQVDLQALNNLKLIPQALPFTNTFWYFIPSKVLRNVLLGLSLLWVPRGHYYCNILFCLFCCFGECVYAHKRGSHCITQRSLELNS